MITSIRVVYQSTIPSTIFTTASCRLEKASNDLGPGISFPYVTMAEDPSKHIIGHVQDIDRNRHKIGVLPKLHRC